MIKLSKEAKILYRDKIAPLLAKNKVEECTDLLYEMNTNTSKEVLAGLCEMGYAFVGYKEVPGEALEYSKITKVVIPEGVEEIGSDAFAHCESLTHIEIPEGVKKIGYYAFYECKELTAVQLPNSLYDIDSHAFDYCASLTSVYLPNSLRRISKHAFDNCAKDITFYIPDGFSWKKVQVNDPDELNWYEKHSKVK